MDKKVYWCARDLDGPPIGNHQFILIAFDNETYAKQIQSEYRIAYKSERKGSATTHFMTLGGFDENSRLVFEANNQADVTSVREWIDPDENTAWYLPDFDLEPHEIEPKDGDADKLIRDVVIAAQTYEEKGPVNYHLTDENCAAWVNTLFKPLGFSQSYRQAKGEFSGVDWGEEDEISTHFFTP